MEQKDDHVVQFKVKRLIRYLDTAKGDGTSMISVIIPPNKKVSDVQRQLTDESGKAEHIKDRVNRQSVLGGITSAKEKLKAYSRVPRNGLLIYCGTVLADDGKQTKKLVIDIEPHKPINTTMYNCGNHFITEPMKELLETNEKYGFLIVDGNGSVYATLQGNARDTVLKFNVDLPKKHGRGGQSCQRFARIRDEKRAAYVKKVCESAVSCFITDDKPNVAGLIVAGYADFKTNVAESQFLDGRLKKIIMNIVDISYGGEQGLSQAIELSKGCLSNIKLVQEQQIVGKFFEVLNIDTGKIIYSIQDTMRALEEGAVEKLLIFDNLEDLRVLLKKQESGDIIVKYMKPQELYTEKPLIDEEDGEELDVVESEALVDWIAENHKEFGAELVFITDKSAEGSQFVRGFAGIGGFLRYKVDYDAQDEPDIDDDDEVDFI